MKCEDVFKETYNREPLQAFCPYRVCPLGAHIDHQDGMIHGMALNYGVHIAYGIKQNGIVELQSLNFPKRVQFHVNDVLNQSAMTGVTTSEESLLNWERSISLRKASVA